MKSLKITLITALFFATLISCTKQDLNEDDLLKAPNVEVPVTGGQYDD